MFGVSLYVAHNLEMSLLLKLLNGNATENVIEFCLNYYVKSNQMYTNSNNN